MKAMMFDRYGGPEVLQWRETPTPLPKDNEVLVRIHATVATPPDCAFRSADPFIIRLFVGLLRPKLQIPGDAMAGVVDSVGRSVTRFRPGDRVFGAAGLGLGAYAEYKCLPETEALVTMPDGSDFGEAVALCEGYLTAMPFLRDEAKLKPGQRILINGASGSVGTIAVQLAKAMGAEVTAVCSGRNAELVTRLGADHVIDYTREDFTRRTAAWDVIFDAVGTNSFARSRGALAAGGTFMTTVPTLNILMHMLRKNRPDGKRAVMATTGLRKPADKIADIAILSKMIAAGRLRAVIDKRMPLAHAAAAHAYVETGRKRGSVVLDIA
ncbi:MAG: NAD(P)-dependent alcohol dehydrogenase [Devosia sp.]